MATPSETFLTGANIDFIEAQYARFLADPAAVDGGWREFFNSLNREGKPLIIDGLRLAAPKANGRTGPVVAGIPAEAKGLQSKVDQTVVAFRLRGHLLAELDPLGEPRKQLEHVADLGLVSRSHFSQAELDTLVDPHGVFAEGQVPLKRVLERLRRTYCHHVGVEYSHLYDSERRHWLRERMEPCENSTVFSVDEQRRVLRKLTEAETFEATIHLKFQGQKRFSAEGGETQVAMLADFLELGAELGIKEVVIGMAHRGRLNVLANILCKPADEIFAEIAGPADPTMFLNRSDVKYHMGYSRDWVTQAGKTVHLSMAFNPSHLGFVYPVVVGRVRAKQERMGGGPAARHAGVPLVIHGDAAFAGQGLVAETLNLAGLDAYDVGGTIHLVINNQIGYTTEARQGRTPLYCTGQAQMLDIPIFHVNGDDPEACVHVMRVAAEYRQRFHSDVVIDLVCYRKYGHNEGDEPAFTQPTMYRKIRAHQTVRQLYAADLAARGRVDAAEAQAIFDECTRGFAEAHARSKIQRSVKDPSHLQGLWAPYVGGLDRDSPQVETGVPEATLKRLLEPLARVPEGFTLHPNVLKGVINKRQAMLRGEEAVDWGTGETLAYATLLAEGTRVRLTGQDTERGTFAHRQAVLHDQATGKTAFPLGDIAPGLARIENSPLSELSCMAFEYGFALDYPDALVAWEAQFGDFANNAQVMIDQFLASGEDKWKRMNALALLLPHGYEGAGPEHSSARLERYLELAAEDNLQICYPTSAAQIFHLLRRQVRRRIRKPLVVMTPKSLLRLAEASSPLGDFARGTYRRVIGEISAAVAPAGVTRLLLCSGKVYFDLKKQRDLSGDTSIAIVRLEQLYPLPVEELSQAVGTYPGLTEAFWVQEEPRNSGAWRNLREPLQALLSSRRLTLEYRGRPETASPATGFLSTHQYEQKLLVEEALSRGAHVR
jgi:2-oxoglutarate dehydrogenase E1 component